MSTGQHRTAVEITCSLLGHQWLRRWYHSIEPAEFRVCSRCGVTAGVAAPRHAHLPPQQREVATVRRFGRWQGGHGAGVPDQTTYRVRCPACGEWAQLRVAESFDEAGTTPVVIMFSCVKQTSDDHMVPGDDELLKLLPGDIIDCTRDPATDPPPAAVTTRCR
jgi:hypothetical protein